MGFSNIKSLRVFFQIFVAFSQYTNFIVFDYDVVVLIRFGWFTVHTLDKTIHLKNGKKIFNYELIAFSLVINFSDQNFVRGAEGGGILEFRKVTYQSHLMCAAKY